MDGESNEKSKGWKGKQDKGHLQELKEFAKYASREVNELIPLKQLIETTKISFLIDNTLN